jgi:hypothetical protein
MKRFLLLIAGGATVITFACAQTGTNLSLAAPAPGTNSAPDEVTIESNGGMEAVLTNKVVVAIFRGDFSGQRAGESSAVVGSLGSPHRPRLGAGTAD